MKTRIFDAAVMIVCVCEYGVEEGMDGSCMCLPTRPQRYCDPASFVSGVFLFYDMAVSVNFIIL